MSAFGNDLIRALTEALAHAKGSGPAIVHPSKPQGSSSKPATDHSS